MYMYTVWKGDASRSANPSLLPGYQVCQPVFILPLLNYFKTLTATIPYFTAIYSWKMYFLRVIYISCKKSIAQLFIQVLRVKGHCNLTRTRFWAQILRHVCFCTSDECILNTKIAQILLSLHTSCTRDG